MNMEKVEKIELGAAYMVAGFVIFGIILAINEGLNEALLIAYVVLLARSVSFIYTHSKLLNLREENRLLRAVLQNIRTKNAMLEFDSPVNDVHLVRKRRKINIKKWFWAHVPDISDKNRERFRMIVVALLVLAACLVVLH